MGCMGPFWQSDDSWAVETTQVQGQAGGCPVLHDYSCFLREPSLSGGARAHLCKYTHTHTHTHTHTPSCLQSSGTRACPHHRGDYKGKDAAHLPGRCSKRLGLGTSCPGPGVIILDGCRSLAETRCIWLCWELGILDSKPSLCLVNCVTLQ